MLTAVLFLTPHGKDAEHELLPRAVYLVVPSPQPADMKAARPHASPMPKSDVGGAWF